MTVPDAHELVARLRADGHGRALDAPTIGAVRRRQGITDAQTRARFLAVLADEMVNELRRVDTLDQLASIRRFVTIGASPCAIAARLRTLADRLHATTPVWPMLHVEREAVA